MPKKTRELKAILLKAGFVYRPAKGSHTFWTHPPIDT
ncbi:type II toxin-antitoxin system HicA family toxin [Nostoc sp. NMS8]|nr:type II toxin-antitoxin system HicA family toxin [Nostoc sp. NMS8]